MPLRISRRQALALTAASAWADTPPATDSLRRLLPRELRPGVAAILARILSRHPSSLNTDWFGTMPLLGALQWSRRDIADVEPFARAWLTHHLNTTDVARYTGNRSRLVWAGGVPLTTYAGHFGISMVCEEMIAQFGDERARRIAADLAAIVLHRTARNRLGLIGHDDTSDFAIPDVTFFVVSSLLIGAQADPPNATAFREQALYQLRTAIDTFLQPCGLAKTLWRTGGVGSTYWTRASGWLLWAITAMLRRIDPQHPAVKELTAGLRKLVDGMIRVQEPEGGFHILLDDPATPLDSTGPAMFALGVQESVRRSWLPPDYHAAAAKAWMFVESNLTEDGALKNTYYLWALPAESRELTVRDETQGWAMGFVLAAANEMTQ